MIQSNTSDLAVVKRTCFTKAYRAAAVLIAVGVLAGLYWWFLEERPRRNAINSLETLVSVLEARNQTIPASLLVVPEVQREKSPEEASQWVRDVLRDEVSLEGLDALRKHGRFGKLTDLFPESATAWAKSAGISPNECLAFRMDRNGVTAEVVLVPGPQGFRISRCNNVKQMALLTGL